MLQDPLLKVYAVVYAVVYVVTCAALPADGICMCSYASIRKSMQETSCTYNRTVMGLGRKVVTSISTVIRMPIIIVCTVSFML
jgi:hypothetical protein